LAPEAWSFAELISAGWRQEDLDWENAAETALECLASGRLDDAREAIALSLRLALATFSRDDPRLGASLANQAARLTESGNERASGQVLDDAVRVWRACDSWVVTMTAPRVARSSLFHLRLEQRHRDAYEERWRVKWGELQSEARGRVDAPGLLRLVAGIEAGERLARWRRERPAMLNDTRKLMGAVLLMVCRGDSPPPCGEGLGEGEG